MIGNFFKITYPYLFELDTIAYFALIRNQHSFKYVNPEFYTKLSKKDKHQTARLIGKLNKILGESDSMSTMLIGPGRWGSTTPSLGIPINFSEINHISILVETDIKYFVLTPKKITP